VAADDRKPRTMSFWEFIWFLFVSFAIVAYLMAMFSIVLDLFRDRSVSGAMKAVWLVALIFFSIITAIVYLVVRGDGMAERNSRDQRAMREAQDDYIRSVAGSSSGSAVDQIAEAKKLLDSGAITEEEYTTLKARHLAH
jgi:predicted PurR-regulated permease PerM